MNIRKATTTDVSTIKKLVKPFVKRGLLLARDDETLKAEIHNFYLEYHNDEVRACSALRNIDNDAVEIYCIAVAEQWHSQGIAKKIVTFLQEEVQQRNINWLYIITKYHSKWCEDLGYTKVDARVLPTQRRLILDKNRGSMIFRKSL